MSRAFLVRAGFLLYWSERQTVTVIGNPRLAITQVSFEGVIGGPDVGPRLSSCRQIVSKYMRT